MPEEDKKNKIEKVKEALYSRSTDGIFAKKRHILKEKADAFRTPGYWEEEEETSPKSFNIPYTKILIGAFIFFVLALGIALFRFFVGTNTVSGGNIDILLTGPVSISGGEELPLDIQVKNNNAVDLKVVDLRIEFPDGTKSSDNLSKDLKRYAEILGDINAGRSERRLIK